MVVIEHISTEQTQRKRNHFD